LMGWRIRGVVVLFMAQYEVVSEVHDYVAFHLMKPSLFTRVYNRLADRMYNPSLAESKKNKAYLPQWRDLRRQIKSFRPQVVIIRNMSLGNALVCLACRMAGIRYLVNYTQTPLYRESSEKKPGSFLAKKVFPGVSFTPVLYRGENRTTRNIPQAWYSPKFFIPLVCEAADVQDKTYCKDGIVHLLDVGKYRGYKNHYLLMDALAAVEDKSRFFLTVIGQLENSSEKEYYDKLSAYVREKGLAPYVDLRGNVPFSEMESVYRQADVLVLPSRSETAGMVILEAMAQGLCVMSGNNCGLASYLDDNDCGFVFSIADPTELTAQLNSLDAEVIAGNGRKSVEVVKEKYGFQNYYEGLKHLMKEYYSVDL